MSRNLNNMLKGEVINTIKNELILIYENRQLKIISKEGSLKEKNSRQKECTS